MAAFPETVFPDAARAERPSRSVDRFDIKGQSGPEASNARGLRAYDAAKVTAERGLATRNFPSPPAPPLASDRLPQRSLCQTPELASRASLGPAPEANHRWKAQRR